MEGIKTQSSPFLESLGILTPCHLCENPEREVRVALGVKRPQGERTVYVVTYWRTWTQAVFSCFELWTLGWH